MDKKKIRKAKIIYGLLMLASLLPGLFGFILAVNKDIGFIVLGLVSFILILPAAFNCSIAEDAEKYHNAISDDPNQTISKLARRLNRDEETVINKLTQMVSKGYITDCYFNSYTQCVTFYKDTGKVSSSTEQETLRSENNQTSSTQGETVPTLNTAIWVGRLSAEEKNAPYTKSGNITDNALIKFKYQLDEMRQACKQINNKEILEKIVRIERTATNIYNVIKSDPEELCKLNSFINYYLPTTLKLITSYAFYETHADPGVILLKTKHDIERALDKVNEALMKQLDMLFTDDMIDISASIQMMETMMAKDGLLEDELQQMMSQQ